MSENLPSINELVENISSNYPKSVNNDGNPIYLSWTCGGTTPTLVQMQDDFFGGGDVGIALTTDTV